jgi:hypothetical protein
MAIIANWHQTLTKQTSWNLVINDKWVVNMSIHFAVNIWKLQISKSWNLKLCELSHRMDSAKSSARPLVLVQSDELLTTVYFALFPFNCTTKESHWNCGRSSEKQLCWGLLIYSYNLPLTSYILEWNMYNSKRTNVRG